ncbi:MAG: RluA family pseudouridine synthase [Candidatus Riflebacteria bacterium]|nr:RluA family pseudouridine synthase [Candidatus Riflebacteria bacterium]
MNLKNETRKEIVIAKIYKGERLDVMLSKELDELSRSLIQSLIKNSFIKVDGKEVKPGYKIKTGEKVLIVIPPAPEIKTVSPTTLDFPILFEDEDIVIVNKPYGLVVHPGAGHEEQSVVSGLLSHTKLSPIGAPLRPGVVHRLDKTTSGVMVLAKTEAAHKKLSRAFTRHLVEKEYIALVQGKTEATRGTIEISIERDRVNRKRMKATSPEKGKPALSHYEVLERFKGYTLVKVTIKTGRTHQIRVHMSYIGHPIAGDVLYNGKKFPGETKLFLHSKRLSLKHPILGKQMEWETPLPTEFEKVVKSLRSPEFPG